MKSDLFMSFHVHFTKRVFPFSCEVRCKVCSLLTIQIVWVELRAGRLSTCQRRGRRVLVGRVSEIVAVHTTKGIYSTVLIHQVRGHKVLTVVDKSGSDVGVWSCRVRALPCPISAGCPSTSSCVTTLASRCALWPPTPSKTTLSNTGASASSTAPGGEDLLLEAAGTIPVSTGTTNTTTEKVCGCSELMIKGTYTFFEVKTIYISKGHPNWRYPRTDQGWPHLIRHNLNMGWVFSSLVKVH